MYLKDGLKRKKKTLHVHSCGVLMVAPPKWNHWDSFVLLCCMFFVLPKNESRTVKL